MAAMFGRLGRRRGALATGGVLGGIATAASSIWYFKSGTASPASIKIVTTAPTPTFTPPADFLFAASDVPTDVCLPQNGTFHDHSVGYSQCDLPSDFYATSAYKFDPLLALLALLVYCTCLHGAVRLRNALLTPKRYATICTTIEHLYNGVSNLYSFATILGVLAAVVEHNDIFTIPALPSYAAPILWLLGSALFALPSAYFASGKVSEVDKARAKLQWIITKRNKTIGVLLAAIKELKSRCDTLAKRLEYAQAEMQSAECYLNADEDLWNQAEAESKQKDADLEDVRAENASKDAEIAKLKKQLAGTNAEKDELSTAVKSLEDDINAANQKNDEQCTKLSGLQRDLDTANTKNGEISAKVKQLETDSANKDTIISEQLTTIEDLEGKLETAYTNDSAQTLKIQELETEVSSINDMIVNHSSTISEQAATISGLRHDLEVVTSTFKTEKSEWATEDAQQKASIASLTTANQYSNKQLVTRTEEIEELRNMHIDSQRTITVLREEVYNVAWSQEGVKSGVAAFADYTQKTLGDRCAKLQGQLEEGVKQREEVDRQNTELQNQIEDLQQQCDTLTRDAKQAPELQISPVLEAINIEPVEKQVVKAGGSDAEKELTTATTLVDEPTPALDDTAAAENVEDPAADNVSNTNLGLAALPNRTSLTANGDFFVPSITNLVDGTRSRTSPAIKLKFPTAPAVDRSSSQFAPAPNLPAKPDIDFNGPMPSDLAAPMDVAIVLKPLGGDLTPSQPLGGSNNTRETDKESKLEDSRPSIPGFNFGTLKSSPSKALVNAVTPSVADRGDAMQSQPSEDRPIGLKPVPKKVFQPAPKPKRYKQENSILSAKDQFRGMEQGNTKPASNVDRYGNSITAQLDSSKEKVHESASDASPTSSTAETEPMNSAQAVPVASLGNLTQPQPSGGFGSTPTTESELKVEDGKPPKKRNIATIKASRLRPEHRIQNTAQKFQDWTYRPERAEPTLVFESDGNIISRSIFTPEAPAPRPGGMAPRPKETRKTQSAPTAPKSSTAFGEPSHTPEVAEHSIEHGDTARKDVSEGKVPRSASDVSSEAASTATDSPITTLNAEPATVSPVSIESTREAVGSPPQKEASPTASDDLDSSLEEETAVRESPNPSAAAPDNAGTTPDTTPPPAPARQPVPDGACYYSQTGVCKYWLRNQCVGDPNNYDAAHEWRKMMPAGVKRFGTNSRKTEGKAKGRAKSREQCCECYVHRRQTGQDDDESEEE